MPSIWDDTPWEEKTIQQATKDGENIATLIFRKPMLFKWNDKDVECYTGRFDIDLNDTYTKTTLDYDENTIVAEVCQAALDYIFKIATLVLIDYKQSQELFATGKITTKSVRECLSHGSPSYEKKKNQTLITIS